MQVFKSFVFYCLVFSVFKISAQQGFMAGLGPTYDFNNNAIGVNSRLYYGPTEVFCFGPEVSFFPYQQIDDQYEASILDLNLNAHYIFELSHKIGVYPLSGLNYTIEKERLVNESNPDEEKEIGLNYGLGAHYNLGKFFAFIEFKGIIGKLSDEFVTVGVIFNLSNKKE